MIRALGIAAVAWAGIAQAQPPADAQALLRKIYQATEKLSYSGVFVYQQGDRTETSRITRVAGGGGGIEKVEALDGLPREIVRTRDGVRCYLPESQILKIERGAGERTFPGMLPEHVAELARNYAIARGPQRRIAGFDCESVTLTPKDELRYGYRLCADVASGMLLKAQTFNQKGETVDQFTFTQLVIGNVPRDRAKARHSARNWRVEDAAIAPANLAKQGWIVGGDLPGFRKVSEVRRQLGESQPVSHVVYSDGLAAVSVFIESMSGRREGVRPGLSSLGAFHIYTREVANHVVTVVGEAPAASVRRIANNVVFRPPQ
jgi:sigma-E factor negative regulatory protein RseB